MNITIKLAGAAAAASGCQEIPLSLEDRVSYTDIIRHLGSLHPELTGVVLVEDGRSLISATLLVRNGEEIIMPQMMDGSPQDDDILQVTTFIVGG